MLSSMLACTAGFAFLLVIDTAWTAVLLRAIACGIVLAVVLSLDNAFRNNVYGRSDPLSFSLLGYSFLLVASDALLTVARTIGPGQPFEPILLVKLVVPALIFVLFLFVLINFVVRAHTRFQRAQQTAVRTYIQELRANTPDVDDKVWQALEELGAETIEPDVFVNKFVNKEPKEDRRTKYLQLVKDLTKANITPQEEQSKLLVSEGRARNSARFWYIVTAVFGTAGALYFFFVR